MSSSARVANDLSSLGALNAPQVCPQFYPPGEASFVAYPPDERLRSMQVVGGLTDIDEKKVIHLRTDQNDPKKWKFQKYYDEMNEKDPYWAMRIPGTSRLSSSSTPSSGASSSQGEVYYPPVSQLPRVTGCTFRFDTRPMSQLPFGFQTNAYFDRSLTKVRDIQNGTLTGNSHVREYMFERRAGAAYYDDTRLNPYLHTISPAAKVHR